MGFLKYHFQRASDIIDLPYLCAMAAVSKVINHSNNHLPEYATEGVARWITETPYLTGPWHYNPWKVPTGLYIELHKPRYGPAVVWPSNRHHLLKPRYWAPIIVEKLRQFWLTFRRRLGRLQPADRDCTISVQKKVEPGHLANGGIITDTQHSSG